MTASPRIADPSPGEETVTLDAESLRRELAAAFASRERPGDDAIALSRPECPGYEGDEARAWLRGKSWRQLLAEGVSIEHRDYLSFLTWEGWLYFLPAFATLALDLGHGAELDEAIVFKLWSFPEEISSRLAPRERRAIVHLLEYLAVVYERRGDVRNVARQALDDYWAYFTDDELSGDGAPGSDAP